MAKREVEVEEDRDMVVDGPELDGTKDKDKLLDDSDDVDDGLDSAEARREQEEEARRKREAGGDEDDDDTRLAYDLDGDDEDGVRGGSRRQRRNRARKQALAEKDRLIEALVAKVQGLEGAFDQMSRGQMDLYAGDLESRLQAERGRLAQIDRALAQAVKDNDGDTYARAQQLRDEARDRIADLEDAGRRLQAAATKPQQRQQEQPQDRGAPRAPDPAAVRYSEVFMDRHPWFDVNGGDEDSRIVKAIDDALADEGYRPNTKVYWQELERRVRARGLGQNDQGDEEMDHEDDGEPEVRRPARRNGGMPPRAGRSGGGRPAGAGGFTLTPFMRDTLDQIGLLDEKGLTDDQRALRKKYVTKWRDGMKEVAAARR